MKNFGNGPRAAARSVTKQALILAIGLALVAQLGLAQSPSKTAHVNATNVNTQFLQSGGSCVLSSYAIVASYFTGRPIAKHGLMARDTNRKGLFSIPELAKIGKLRDSVLYIKK